VSIPVPRSTSHHPLHTVEGVDETALDQRARRDPDAFAELYRLHCPAITRYIRRRYAK